MTPNIVFLDEYSLGGADTQALRSLGNYTSYETTEADQTVARSLDADIVITNKVLMDRAVIESLPRLRLICVAATGTNNVDLEAARERGVAVKNVAGYSTHSVAEAAVGAAIALFRQSLYYDRYTKERYAASGLQFHFGRPTRQLHGARWGIVGLGNIGREVAKIATVLGCEVRYTSTSGVVREEPYPAVALSELLPWADIVSVHCPLNSRTHGLIGAPELSLMKHSAILVNVARGGIVSEPGLAEALDRGKIAGAALDVFEHEPLPAESPLLHIKEPDRLLLSPHNAWSAQEAVRVLVREIARNITEFLA